MAEKQGKLIHLTLKKETHGNRPSVVAPIPSRIQRTRFYKGFITSIPQDVYDKQIKGTDMEDWFEVISEAKYKEINAKFGVKAKKELEEKPLHSETPQDVQYHEVDPVKQRAYDLLISEGVSKEDASAKAFGNKDSVTRHIKLKESNLDVNKDGKVDSKDIIAVARGVKDKE